MVVRDRSCRTIAARRLASRLAACLLIIASSICEACPSQHAGDPLLGEYRPSVRSNAPLLLRIEQHDLDLKVLVRTSAGDRVHDSPGERNAIEWVLLPPSEQANVALCLYPVYRQPSADAYRITPIPLPTAHPRELHAFHSISEAGALWGEGTQNSRVAAIELYDKASLAAVATLNASDYARLYAALARFQRYQLDEALTILKPLAWNERTPDAVRYVAHWYIGEIENIRGQLEHSKASLQRALTMAENLSARASRPFVREIAAITNRLGEVHLASGELAEGEKLVRHALSIAGSDDQALGMIYNNLGYVHLRLADTDLPSRRRHLSASLAEHSKAREHASRANDRKELTIIENNLATVFERLGDLRMARRHYEEALRLIDKTDDPLRFELLYRALGHTYQYLGDYAKSEQFLRAAAEMADRSAPHDAIQLHCHLGTTLRLRSRIAAAIEEHSTCAERARQAQNLMFQVHALHELAMDYQLSGDLTRAWTTIQPASSLLARISNPDAAVKVLVRSALLLQERGQLKDAIAPALQAIEIAERARYPTAKIDALAAAMRIHAAQGFHAQSIAHGMKALDEIERLHAHFDAERLGPAWSARTERIYVDLAEQMLREYRKGHRTELLWSALNVLERSRAIGLRQQFSAGAEAIKRLDDDEILTTLSRIANEHARSQDERDLPVEYYHEHDLLTLSRLAGVPDLPVPAPLTAKDLQRSVKSDQVVLSYFMGDEDAYLFLLTPSGLRLVELGPRKLIDELVTHVRRAAAEREDRLVEYLRQLSASIVPDLEVLRAREWIIVADGSLHYVPFSALFIPSREPFLPTIASHSVRIIPSMSAYWMPKRTGAREYSTELAVFADPIFGTSAAAEDFADGRTRSFAGWTEALQRLPWTASEAERLKSLLAPLRTTIFTGASATRANLRSVEARNARVLHIASHGYFNAASPENVGFALSVVDEEENFDPGFMSLAELFSYRFNNELVVVSGCDSALGQQSGGEGLISLTRGFMAQGASNVISTLWPVSDRASAEFIGLFYARLLEIGSVSEALRQAQEDMRSKPQYQDPFFWAPYTVSTVDPSDRIQFPQKTSMIH